MDLATIIAIASFLLSAGSMIWIGGFRFSALIQKIESVGEGLQNVNIRIDKLGERMDRRFEKLEVKIDRLEIELHKIDVRVSVLEKNRH